jgi:hypothetical protein
VGKGVRKNREGMEGVWKRYRKYMDNAWTIHGKGVEKAGEKGLWGTYPVTSAHH